LLDHLGRPVSRESLRGKPWIANFIFTRCAFECPLLLRNTYSFHRDLVDVDFRIVTITVDPKYDTVEVMQKQSQVFGVDPERWLFVTGEPAKVYELIRTGFKQAAWENVGTNRQPGMEFAHSLNMIHVDAEGRIIGKYDGRREADLGVLRRVLKGEIDTPARHRPVAITTAPPASADVSRAPAAGAAPGELPAWAQRLPATNAMLNTLATVLLIGGLSAIRMRNVRLHRKLMLFAFGASIAFLGCYLAYHWALQEYTGSAGRKYAGPESLRTVYYGVLISHVVLAAVTPIGAVTALWFAFRKQWSRHRRVARVIFPIWLYVSITGVLIYWMLYHLPAAT
jgi:protein SCO1/2/putative membrane protein